MSTQQYQSVNRTCILTPDSMNFDWHGCFFENFEPIWSKSDFLKRVNFNSQESAPNRETKYRMIHVPIPSSRQIVAAMKMVGGTGPRGMTIFPVWMVHSVYSYYFTFCLASIIHALVCSIYQLKRARWFAILLKQRRFRKWYAIAS